MNKPELNKYSKVVLEIGCGGGYFLKSYNNQFNDGNLYLIGVELSKGFYNKALKRLKKFEHKNWSVLQGDIREKLKDLDGIKFDEIHINFPDPWFKYKHKKRILCRASFLNLLSNYLKKEGFISIVTDNFDLCVRIITGINKLNSLKNVYLPKGYKTNFPFPETTFYRKAKKNDSDIYFIKLAIN